ncbi:MAG TPA: GGDEF domain-containing protein [Clostridiales bacterium]|nr:GGDEF domain-containing protein [Clostridiales bacterium]
MEEFAKVDNTVCILTNYQVKVYYSNIDKDSAEKYLDDINILDHMPVDRAINYKLGEYSISVEKVVLDERIYYLVLIQQQGKLYKYAYKDSLTGLYNRNYWEQLIAGMLNRSIPERYTLIIIDMDNLKRINDNSGHLAGDRAIWIVGDSIRRSIRSQDIAIRYGGDEFLILLANTKMDIVKNVINRIKRNIRKKGKEENIEIEISTGTACSGCPCEIGKVIALADSKMYKEKAIKRSKQIYS